MPTKPPRRTRQRILDTALALFNRDGEPNVTTAHIADEMNISPGNLYYHFRNKDDIIGELYAAHEASLAPLLDVPPERSVSVEDLWLLLHLLFERMGAYRFLYRDLDEITSRNRRVALAFAALVRRGESAVRTLADGLAREGVLEATSRERAALARNVVLVCTYWMSFQRVSQVAPASVAQRDTARIDPGQAAYQVLALVAPFLVGDARALVERLGEDYL
ncbi:MAG TPA: TetR/AcrR family transcriptional regulator [Casimicrobiaceae bacterium]|jgi:AcrR family transcriptional regulator|nr:TetR/AcrR family transcriptional regulator [Casimicrobiaceae bacterium]